MVVSRSRYVTVSVKIPREVKEKLEGYGVKISEVVRKAIEEEFRRVVVEELKKEIEKNRDIIDKISTEFIVESIREDRERR